MDRMDLKMVPQRPYLGVGKYYRFVEIGYISVEIQTVDRISGGPSLIDATTSLAHAFE